MYVRKCVCPAAAHCADCVVLQVKGMRGNLHVMLLICIFELRSRFGGGKSRCECEHDATKTRGEEEGDQCVGLRRICSGLR